MDIKAYEEGIVSRITIYDLPDDEEPYERDDIPNSFEKLSSEETRYVIAHPELLKRARHVVVK